MQKSLTANGVTSKSRAQSAEVTELHKYFAQDDEGIAVRQSKCLKIPNPLHVTNEKKLQKGHGHKENISYTPLKYIADST